MNATHAQTTPEDAGPETRLGGDHDGTSGLAVVLRGYDRQQVDALVQELRGRLEAEQQRAVRSERAMERAHAEVAALKRAPAPSFEQLGAHAAEVLERAGHSAKVLVDEATSKGNQIVEEAAAEAMEMIKKAEQRTTELENAAAQTLAEANERSDRILAKAGEDAREVHRRAEDEAQRTLEETREEADQLADKATRERMAIEARCDRLRTEVERLQGYLGRVHSQVGTLLEDPSQPTDLGVLAPNRPV